MNEDDIKKRVKVFMDKDIPAHIILKDNTWLNGYIVEVSDEFFMFLERKQGILPVFYIDVRLFEFFIGDMSTLKRKEEKDGTTS